MGWIFSPRGNGAAGVPVATSRLAGSWTQHLGEVSIPRGHSGALHRLPAFSSAAEIAANSEHRTQILHPQSSWHCLRLKVNSDLNGLY